jgi:hypothetical protein
MTALVDQLRTTDEPTHPRHRTLLWRDDVVRLLRDYGLTVGRPLAAGNGTTDRGEIDGVPGWSVLVRRQQTLDLPGTLAQAEEHAARHGNRRSAAVFHRRAHEIESAYVVFTLATFAELLARTTRITADEGARS